MYEFGLGQCPVSEESRPDAAVTIQNPGLVHDTEARRQGSGMSLEPLEPLEAFY